MITFKEYEYKEDVIGKGWQLYSDGSPSPYYFFLKKGSKDYELFYGNGFFLARCTDFDTMKELTLEIFEKHPLVGFHIGYDNNQFKSIQEIPKNKNFDTKLDLSKFEV